MNQCHICQAQAVALLLDFGDQALCNRFLTTPQEPESTFPFKIGQCGNCGLVQIIQPIAPEELKPRFDWITYNEQEGHLDHLVETICKLSGVSADAAIGAISFKDDTTLARFEKLGFQPSWRLNPARDLNIQDTSAGLETVQARLTTSTASVIAKKNQLLDVLIVRHILEHAHQPNEFANALRQLVKPGGYLVFEVPDCTPALERGDYTMPWEEHISCFTPETFKQSLVRLGFSVTHQHCYPYTNENSLVAIVKASPDAKKSAAETVPPNELQRAQKYAAGFLNYRQRAREALAAHRSNGERIAIFGAGHLSCAWVNFLGVQDQIDFVADDHPKKKGMFMPGSRLPILGSAMLLERHIKLCLLGLSPESEARVIAKNEAFLAQGGVFASLFPGRGNSLPR